MFKFMCHLCNNIIKYNSPLLKNKKNKNSDGLSINYICDECINLNNYIAISDSIEKCKDITSNLFFNDGKMYILKKDWLKNYKKEQRKINLINRLKEMKLPFIKNSMCSLHINYGKPDLDFIIKSIHETQKLKTDRLCKLLKKLQEKNLDYNCKIPSYKKFIVNGGDIDKTIKNGEIEKMIIDNTDYLSMLDNVDSETARELSVNDYLSNNKKRNNVIDNFVLEKNTIVFD